MRRSWFFRKFPMRRFALLLAVPFLAGCSDMGHLMNFGGDPYPEVAAATPVAAPAPAAAGPAAPDAFCMGVAKGDATRNDFDAATQQRVAQRSYAQCVTIFGSPQ
jgi:hypothetical protein